MGSRHTPPTPSPLLHPSISLAPSQGRLETVKSVESFAVPSSPACDTVPRHAFIVFRRSHEGAAMNRDTCCRARGSLLVPDEDDDTTADGGDGRRQHHTRPAHKASSPASGNCDAGPICSGSGPLPLGAGGGSARPGYRIGDPSLIGRRLRGLAGALEIGEPVSSWVEVGARRGRSATRGLFLPNEPPSDKLEARQKRRDERVQRPSPSVTTGPRGRLRWEGLIRWSQRR